jgi:hypothetical protein
MESVAIIIYSILFDCIKSIRDQLGVELQICMACRNQKYIHQTILQELEQENDF